MCAFGPLWLGCYFVTAPWQSTSDHFCIFTMTLKLLSKILIFIAWIIAREESRVFKEVQFEGVLFLLLWRSSSPHHRHTGVSDQNGTSFEGDLIK